MFHLRCIVKKSQPKPEFSWYVDEDLSLNSHKVDENSTHFFSILSYEPRKDHHNKTLSCQVDFKNLQGFELPLKKSIMLEFTEDILANLPVVTDDANDKYTPSGSEETTQTAIISVVVAVLVICVLIFGAYRICLCRPKISEEVMDVESAKKTDDEKDATDDGMEKVDLEKEDTEVNEKGDQEILDELNKTIGDRFTKFFRMNKSVQEPEKETETEVNTVNIR